jgi:polyisoprenyl-teichoic acid--peptidoglycan teichoic acid transferase
MSAQVAPPKHRSPGARRVEQPLQRGRHASSRGDGFARFAGVTVMSLVPGAGLLAVGRRKLGTVLVLMTISAVVFVAVVLISGGLLDRVAGLASSPDKLLVAAVLVAAGGVFWCLTILNSAWRARPERTTPGQGLLGLGLVGLVCLAVAAPSVIGTQMVLTARDTSNAIFGKDSGPGVAGAARPGDEADPWAGTARVNLLLLGSDAGADRTGVRTDSMIVASIDTKTGNTVLIGLPRSLQKVPFPESNPLNAVWPDGFNCGDECLLNAVWDQAAVARKDLFPGNPNPGLTTTRDVIGEITGLRIDAYATIDLRGFQSLVDAMGGVEVNVTRRIPIGGKDSGGNDIPVSGYIEPGKQRLTGYRALWFSRSRLGADDYDRMRRQRCMVGNLVDQVNPVRLLAQYAELAKVLKENIRTDVQQADLKAWIVLVQRMQKGSITSLPFTNSVIDTVDPDFPAIRQYVAQSLTPQAPTTPTTKAPTGGSGAKKPKPTPTDGSETDSTKAQDINAVC